MRTPKQTRRYNDIELGLFKKIFADDENLLFTIRKVLLQFELTPEEAAKVKEVVNGDVMKLIRKAFMPEIDPDSPLFQLCDMRIALNNDLKLKDVREMQYLFDAKKLEMDYMNQQLDILEGKSVNTTVWLKDLAEITTDQYLTYVNLTAWNYLISYIDSYCNEIKLLAGTPDETIDQTMKRLTKDSSK